MPTGSFLYDSNIFRETGLPITKLTDLSKRNLHSRINKPALNAE